jgi:Demerecviridae HNH endonuclease
MTGDRPEAEIDHIDGDPGNDRFSNLRSTTRSQNLCNRRTMRNNRSGHKGVSWSKTHNNWRVQIYFNRAHIFIGMFDDLETAAAAASQARNRLHGEFANHGRHRRTAPLQAGRAGFPHPAPARASHM